MTKAFDGVNSEHDSLHYNQVHLEWWCSTHTYYVNIIEYYDCTFRLIMWLTILRRHSLDNSLFQGAITININMIWHNIKMLYIHWSVLGVYSCCTTTLFYYEGPSKGLQSHIFSSRVESHKIKLFSVLYGMNIHISFQNVTIFQFTNGNALCLYPLGEPLVISSSNEITVYSKTSLSIIRKDW